MQAYVSRRDSAANLRVTKDALELTAATARAIQEAVVNASDEPLRDDAAVVVLALSPQR